MNIVIKRRIILENAKENLFLNDFEKYFDLMKNLLHQRITSHVPRAFVRTYGCQQNASDSEKLKGMLSAMGCDFANSCENADIIVFNTCAVRENAEDRVFGNVGALKSLKKKNPSLIIAICGCMMEQQHIADKIKLSFPFVDLVFGTNSLHMFPKFIYEVLTEKKRIFKRDINDDLIHEGLPIKREGSLKAFLPIMYGCNNFCSYCVVPYVRGREKSRDSGAILNEFSQIVNEGYKDITLLGQNVNSYGKTLNENINFAQLLKRVDNIFGDYWLRFMTSHPKDATKELIDVMAQGKHICHHLHLPFQSGSNRILTKMNRRYTREKYLEIVAYIKEKIPNISLTSDVIVGFPGETYDDFCETLSLIKEVGFTSLFTFIYSKRVGTPAAKMEDPISEKEKSAWFKELLQVQNNLTEQQCKKYVRKTIKVLIEGKSTKPGYLTARTQGNIIVDLAGNENLIGKFAMVDIVDTQNWFLKGKLISVL